MSKLPSRIRPRTKTNMAKKFYRLKRRYGYYAIGAVIQPQPNVADMLMKQDIVELVEPPAEIESPKEDVKEPVKRPRGRPKKNPEK